MTAQDITDQLRAIEATPNFAERTKPLVDAWESAQVGVEAVEPILKFMEEHSDMDFGMPGALVHFVERFHQHGYEDKLIESIKRKPTSHTIWMLNRVINGSKSEAAKRQLISVMEQAKSNSSADLHTLQRIDHFMKRIGLD
jgi:hypothetical protein